MTVGAIRRDGFSTPFFEGTAGGELPIRACRSCGHRSLPLTRQCPACRSTDLGWQPASGRGRVVSWAVVHGRAGADGVPQRTVIGIIELDEGPWFNAQLAVDPDDVAVGSAVQVRFETPDGGEAVPVFELA